MEGQYVPPAGEPPKVRNRKPRARNPTDQAPQGVQGQQPPIRGSNRGPLPQQQPEAANWAYNQGDQYDPAHGYPEQYGYGTGEHVDAHGYSYGGAHVDADQGYGYGGAHADASHGYDYGGAHADASHGYDYGGAHADASHGYDYGGAHADAGQGHAYGYDYDYGDAVQEYGYGQEHGYGGAKAHAGQDHGYVAPTQQVKPKVKKPRNPRPVADGGEQHRAGYENQEYGYGHPVESQYSDGYSHPEAYNAVVPEQQPIRNPPKRESKHRKPTRTKSMENGNQGDGESAVVSTGEPDEVGSVRSSGSNRSKPDRSDRTLNPDAAGRHHHRASNRMEQDGTSPRVNAIARDHREEGSSRSNPERRKQKLENEVAKPVKSEANALNEHLRKTGGGKPAFQDISMAVFDPRDQTTLVTGMPEPPHARPSLGEWVKKQDDKAGPRIQQDESLIVYDDHDKSELETRMFGAPLAKKQPIKLPPVEEQWDKPQYAQPRENHQYQAPEKPLYEPARQRRPYANSHLPQAYQVAPPIEAGAIQQTHAAENKQALQVAEPNEKCMACVHSVAVPVARLATRIACRQCGTCCTIL